MVDHIVFDTFGESIVSLSSEVLHHPTELVWQLLILMKYSYLMVFMHASASSSALASPSRSKVRSCFEFCDGKDPSSKARRGRVGSKSAGSKKSVQSPSDRKGHS